MKNLEFFWDAASPYTYLASTQIPKIRERTNAQIVIRPFLLGGVFKSTGNEMPAEIPAKATWMLDDLKRWSQHYGVEMKMPITEVAFPVRSITAMRAASAVDDADSERFMHAIMAAYWARGVDIGDPTNLSNAISEAGFDAEKLMAATQDQAIKDKLRATTDEAVHRGAFGAPAMFVGKAHFWGNDRLHFVEAELTS